MTALMPEPPDKTRFEFEYGTDTYGVWRDDESGRRAGWETGPGGPNWVVYGSSVPISWEELAEEFDVESLNGGVRMTVHPDDVHRLAMRPTAKWRAKRWKPTTGDTPPARHSRRGRAETRLV
jgi:hypothetical protein